MTSSFNPLAAGPRCRAAAGALCAALAMAAPLPAQAQSGASSPPAAGLARFDIPAGPLGPALTAFAGAARINLSDDPALAEGLRTAGLL
ncbi:TonB-dependent siderophore receptor, partial [Achromobacter spanius]